MKRALIVIDVQNDYFADGAFPLWNADAVLDRTVAAIGRARAAGIPVILVQHIAAGPSPLFVKDSHGAELHPRIRAAAPDAPVVVKSHADSFLGTTLEATLAQLGIEEILLCGMMTQNCVTHTALSRTADKYAVKLLGDCCTTVSEILHKFALSAIAPRTPVVSWETAF